MRWLPFALVALVACNKKAAEAPVVAPPPDAAPTLGFDPPSTDSDASALPVAFGDKIPRLPAVSADGSQLANLDHLGDGPMEPPFPLELVVRKVDGDSVLERLPLLDETESTTAAAAGERWKTPELTKTLQARGSAIRARLRGFRSLEPVKLAQNGNGESVLTQVGDLVLLPDELELRDGKGGVLQRAEVEAYSTGSGLTSCSYTPLLRDVHRDPTTRTLYVEVGYRYRDDCDAPGVNVFAWSEDPARASPDAAVHGIVTRQFDMVGVTGTSAAELALPDALVVSANLVGSAGELKRIGVADKAMDYSNSQVTDVQVVLARDGKSAWASELASVALLERNRPGRDAPWRASDVLVQTPQGWKLAALAWTEPKDNGDAKRAAKAGKLQAAKLEAEPGDAGLREAFARLCSDGVDAAAAARADLVAIGSGPGERTVGGDGFARAWNAAWKGKVDVVSSVARTTPSGTTGWVAATVDLARPGYKMPFTIFAVFDKAADGKWSLVHIHFAV